MGAADCTAFWRTNNNEQVRRHRSDLLAQLSENKWRLVQKIFRDLFLCSSSQDSYLAPHGSQSDGKAIVQCGFFTCGFGTQIVNSSRKVKIQTLCNFASETAAASRHSYCFEMKSSLLSSHQWFRRLKTAKMFNFLAHKLSSCFPALRSLHSSFSANDNKCVCLC